ncbi:hypothetical protein LNKW23_01580 [Paralimibaculum aggregatum]|uniref:Peptidoglycan-binding protein n=1 Tax=Paralimibaculum aggregatum TaxID=3036245 RepID=A0ABQ6LKL4_9RHOB|nr:M15 family metallopeptidase [Limibaculum sp. NKW23]GMG80946.1 hypothetical protein LNKW23_01580 [Limibaculum sp. NKW23]
MPFPLKRGGRNQPLEVQRLQYFLLRQGFPQTGHVDGRFGAKTESAVRAFQDKYEIRRSGRFDTATLAMAADLGYTVVNDDHYDAIAGDWPDRPAGLSRPDAARRNALFGCFRFRQNHADFRADPDQIEILDSCDRETRDWESVNIIDLAVPEFERLPPYGARRMRLHRAAAERFRALIDAWAAADLLHLLIAYVGAYNPRYIRGASGRRGHGIKHSTDVGNLSNHAFGTAFDVNNRQNGYGAHPAEVSHVGSVRELVPLANAHGVYWGGHFGKRDGMHFELAEGA